MIDVAYRVLLFGDFESIEATPENMSFMFENFSKYKLMPSVNEELLFNPMVDRVPRNLQRIALLSEDGNKRFLINSNIIDFGVQFSSNQMLNDAERGAIDGEIVDITESLFQKYNKKANRLAINSSVVDSALPNDKIADILQKYSNPIPFYNNKRLDEWSAHLMVKNDFAVLGENETINVITNLLFPSQIFKRVEFAASSETDQSVTSSPKETELESLSMQIEFDINTAPENMSFRFTVDSLADFLKEANRLRSEILSSVY